jgi:hypothetical protein
LLADFLISRFAISRFEVEGVRGFNNKYLMKYQAKASLFDIKH